MKLPDELHKSWLMQAEECLFAADQYANHYAVKEATEPMIFGTWAHDHWRALACHEITAEQALAVCETPDGRQVIENILAHDPWLFLPDLRVYPELFIRLDNEWNLVNDSDPAAWGGTLDQAVIGDHELCVVDGKSGWGLKVSYTEMAMYAVLFSSWYEATHDGHEASVNFTYFHFRSGRRTQHTIWVHDAKIHLLSLRRELEAAAPIPMPGTHCQWCQFCGTICPLGMSTLPVSAPGVPAEILRRFVNSGEFLPEHAPVLGLAKVFLEEQAKKIGRALKGHVAEHGPIILGDSEYVLSERDNDKWDHEKVNDILSRAQVPDGIRSQVCTISKRSAWKLKADYPQVLDDLFRYARIPAKPTQELVLKKRVSS